jgi:hypothetical protein
MRRSPQGKLYLSHVPRTYFTALSTLSTAARTCRRVGASECGPGITRSAKSARHRRARRPNAFRSLSIFDASCISIRRNRRMTTYNSSSFHASSCCLWSAAQSCSWLTGDEDDALRGFDVGLIVKGMHPGVTRRILILLVCLGLIILRRRKTPVICLPHRGQKDKRLLRVAVFGGRVFLPIAISKTCTGRDGLPHLLAATPGARPTVRLAVPMSAIGGENEIRPNRPKRHGRPRDECARQTGKG